MGNFIREVYVVWGVDKVQLVGFIVVGFIVQGDVLCFDGDFVFVFKIYGVQNLGFYFMIRKVIVNLDDMVRQC